MRSDGGQSGRGRSRRWLVAVAGLVVSLLPMTGAGATEEPASSDESSPGAAGTPAVPEPEDLAGGVEVVRYAGSDPYELSIELAQALVDADGGTSEWVVLASGESWADAAAAGPLAATLDAPVVLVPPGGLQSSAARPDLVEFLGSAGIRRVVIVGDPDTLPNHEPSVLYGLGMLPRNIERIYGSDPVGTAVAVAERIGAAAELGVLGRTVIIASDRSVADAVAIGPLATAGPLPLLLTDPDALDQRIIAYLTDQQVAHVVLVGGTTAIAPSVQESLKAADVTVTRLAGRDRDDTARLAASLFDRHTAENSACARGPTRLGLAPARHPEYALTAGPLLAQRCTALRFAGPDQLSPDLRNTLYLARQRPHDIELHVFASENAIADVALEFLLPPMQLAFVSVDDISESGKRNTQIALVDEHGAIRLFPQTKADASAWLPWGPVRRCQHRDLEWSPTGRLLSYRHLCTGEIFVLDTGTGESYRVVSEDAELIFEDISYGGGPWYAGRMGPLWSPDGSSFVFTAFVDDPTTVGTWQGNPLHFAELFVHDTESRTTRRLTENAAHDLVGSWSPNGKIVTTMQHFEPAASDPYYRAHRSYAFTSVSEEEPAPQLARCGIGRGATWSSGGTDLAYYVSNGWWTHQVEVCTAGGSSRRQLTPVNCNECSEGRQHSGPRILGWNRDGSLLAFSDSDFVVEDGEFDHQTETTAGYVLDLESGGIRKLFELTHDAYSPSPLVYLEWSRKNDGLLYLRLGESESVPQDLVLLNDATGGITTLRDIPLLWPFQDQPVQARLLLSPDQSQLLLTYDGTWPGRDGGMWLTSIQPGDLTPLIDFGPIISLAAGDFSADSRLFPPKWRCATEWSAIGVLSTCGYDG